MKKTLITIALLVGSNSFMNTAWYGHLRFKSTPISVAILGSWSVAFLEYCLQVPANRVGSDVMSITQLKVLQEVLSIGTFAVFAWVAFREKPSANQYAAFALIVLAAYLAAKR